MQFIVSYRGVALGTIDLEHAGITGGNLRVLPGYEAVRALVSDATLATANHGFLGPVDDPQSTQRALEQLEAHGALLDELELRSAADGAIVPCEFLDLTHTAGSDAPPIVFVSLQETFSTIGAKVASSSPAGSPAIVPPTP